MESFTNPQNTTIMAKITPIDIIKGISGKFGGGKSKEYFATNKSSYNILFAKKLNLYPVKSIYLITYTLHSLTTI